MSRHIGHASFFRDELAIVDPFWNLIAPIRFRFRVTNCEARENLEHATWAAQVSKKSTALFEENESSFRLQDFMPLPETCARCQLTLSELSEPPMEYDIGDYFTSGRKKRAFEQFEKPSSPFGIIPAKWQRGSARRGLTG